MWDALAQQDFKEPARHLVVVPAADRAVQVRQPAPRGGAGLRGGVHVHWKKNGKVHSEPERTDSVFVAVKQP